MKLPLRNRWLQGVSILAVAIGAGAMSFAAFSEQAPKGAVATITQLYHDYAWQVVINEPDNAGIDLFDQPAEVLNRYFDPHMVELIVRDRQCKERTHDVCRLDYAPIWDSQDPGARDMKIHLTPDPSKVAVDFIYPGDKSRMHIVYVLSKTRDGWRITDIQGSSGSLRKVLELELPP